MDTIEEAIAELKRDIEALSRQMKRLVRSDRAQTHKLKLQYRISMFLLGLAAIGGFTLFGELSAENKASLERIAMGLIAAGLTGAVGVSLPGFEPPGSEEAPGEAPEDEI